MNPLHCCRTCLSEESLNQIYSIDQNSDKYTDTLFSIIGLKIHPNDDLPHTLCTPCIDFLNQIIDFKKQCLKSNRELQNRLENKKIYNKFIECENEKFSKLNIDSGSNEGFSDQEDNLPLGVIKNHQKNFETENKLTPIVLENRRKKEIENHVRKREKGVKVEIENNMRKTVKERIECEHCDKVLTSKTSLRNHYKIHLGFDVVCEHCGKKFITKRLLLMHCKAKHGYEKTDKCSYCDYTASNAEQVKIHERLHTGEKPYTCETCKSGFHRKSSYLQHVAIHLPEKTVQCDQCPALFKSVTLMRIHRNRHRMPSHKFVCVLCNWNFVRRRNATRHIHRAHRIVASNEHIRKVAVNNVT